MGIRAILIRKRCLSCRLCLPAHKRPKRLDKKCKCKLARLKLNRLTLTEAVAEAVAFAAADEAWVLEEIREV